MEDREHQMFPNFSIDHLFKLDPATAAAPPAYDDFHQGSSECHYQL